MSDLPENKLVLVLKSRKSWAAAVALLVAFLGDRAGVDQETLTGAIVVFVSYILGTALEDGLARRQ